MLDLVRDSKSSRLRFSDISVAVLEPNADLRQLIRGALQGIGFEDVRLFRDVDELAAILAADTLDLVILDLDGDMERICGTVRDIRHELLGSNPFVVIMALTWTPESDVIKRTLNAGTDDLVAKPVSAQILMDRITNLVTNRKKFVATMSYVGPDRRAAARPEADELPAIDVPNGLRQKAAGDDAVAANEISVQETLRTVRSHRVYRIATDLVAQSQNLEQLAAQDGETPLPQQRIRDLADLVVTARQYIFGEDFTQLSRIGKSMSDVMDSITAAVLPTAQQLEVLRLHAQAIAAAVKEPDQAAELLSVALREATGLIKSARRLAPQ